MPLPSTPPFAVSAQDDAFGTAIADELSAKTDTGSTTAWGSFDTISAAGAAVSAAESVISNNALATFLQSLPPLTSAAGGYNALTGQYRRASLNYVKSLAVAIAYQIRQKPTQLAYYAPSALPTSGLAQGAVAVRGGDASMPGSAAGIVVWDGSAWHNAAGSVVT